MTELTPIQKEILDLKREKGALILAHYYVPLEVQDVADHVCDSFAMAKLARDAKEDVIVICGVRFMGESAKLLAPGKTVLLPCADAGCPMADTVTPEDIRRLRSEHPNAVVMCYVNSSADVKAECDICCTSSSALRIAAKLDAEEIIFVPDKNLGDYTAKTVAGKKFIIHSGCCPVHDSLTEADVIKAKAEHPDAVFAVHPECTPEILKHADFIGSTAEIIDYAKKLGKGEMIIGTENEISVRLNRDIPEMRFYDASPSFICVNMKKITAEKLRDCLKNGEFEVTVDPENAKKANAALDKMVKS